MGEETMGEEAMDERELRRGDFPLRRGEFFWWAIFVFRSTDWSALPIQRLGLHQGRPTRVHKRKKGEKMLGINPPTYDFSNKLSGGGGGGGGGGCMP